MIEKALQFTNTVLEEYLQNKMGLDEKKVVLNNVIDPDGAIPSKNANKVVLSLINVAKETVKPFYNRQTKLQNGNFSHMAPIEKYNLHILSSSNFDDYRESLKFLNETILFFQINGAIDASSYSSLPIGLRRLEFEIEKIDYHQTHSLWNAMGAKYQPSVIYKMRLITLNPNEVDAFDSAVKTTKTSITS
ncbi:MAG: DUF4255 domain-containing protein [Bacteroidetes bacterium]|nr:DUF4255 domain-containing protein [Bacteroidota bacterium]